MLFYRFDIGNNPIWFSCKLQAVSRNFFFYFIHASNDSEFVCLFFLFIGRMYVRFYFYKKFYAENHSLHVWCGCGAEVTRNKIWKIFDLLRTKSHAKEFYWKKLCVFIQESRHFFSLSCDWLIKSSLFWIEVINSVMVC